MFTDACPSRIVVSRARPFTNRFPSALAVGKGFGSQDYPSRRLFTFITLALGAQERLHSMTYSIVLS